MGMLERGGQVRANVIATRRKPLVQAEVRAHVEPFSAIYTDTLLSYEGLSEQDFLHETIDHAERYVDGRIHTNGLENFWSLLKRGLKGTCVSVEPFHLFRYLDEQVFRYNFRATKKNPLNDGDRFEYGCQAHLREAPHLFRSDWKNHYDVWPAQLGSLAGSGRFLRFLPLFRALFRIYFVLYSAVRNLEQIARERIEIFIFCVLCGFHALSPLIIHGTERLDILLELCSPFHESVNLRFCHKPQPHFLILA